MTEMFVLPVSSGGPGRPAGQGITARIVRQDEDVTTQDAGLDSDTDRRIRASIGRQTLLITLSR